MTKLSTTFVLVILSAYCYSQQKELKDYEAVNRTLTSVTVDGITGIQVDARESDGLVWIRNTQFSSGVIEFDVMGENKKGASFVGIAFHAVDEKTFDCVYFRPFNFVAEAQINRDHMVQYVSLPAFDWETLRETRTGQFEKEIKNAPDPNKWLHAKIEVLNGEVKVFVNNAKDPSLVVTKLNARTTGKIGFWVGFNSAGKFANLKISK